MQYTFKQFMPLPTLSSSSSSSSSTLALLGLTASNVKIRMKTSTKLRPETALVCWIFQIFYFLFARLECPPFRCLPALTLCGCCCCTRCTQLRIASISGWLTFASLSLSSVCLCVMFYNISSNVYSHHHNVGLHVNFLGRLFCSQHSTTS